MIVWRIRRKIILLFCAVLCTTVVDSDMDTHIWEEQLLLDDCLSRFSLGCVFCTCFLTRVCLFVLGWFFCVSSISISWVWLSLPVQVMPGNTRLQNYICRVLTHSLTLTRARAKTLNVGGLCVVTTCLRLQLLIDLQSLHFLACNF